MSLSEDQVAQLLPAFWIQANLSDNKPSNFEAVSHSFNLTLISSCLRCLGMLSVFVSTFKLLVHQNQTHNVVCFFLLPLSLRSISLDPHNGMLPASCQRSLFVLVTAVLMSTAKTYHIPDIYDYLKSLVSYDSYPCIIYLLSKEEQRSSGLGGEFSQSDLQKKDKMKSTLAQMEMDPEAAKEQALKQEFKRAEERLTLKHKNKSKWAKHILKCGLHAQDEGTRAAISEQLHQHNLLSRKMNSMKYPGKRIR